ncbi:MAG: tRNA (adenosine(37)-N6)-threonylcarbamoyltransferase complex transferase subunit TsaD [Patescibacteria group bacterium]
MIVLAIESTCDETGAAVAKGYGEPMAVEILSDVKASSAEIHAKYGGVIPEIAAREQIAAIIPVITEAMAEAGVGRDEIEAVAVTQGPGLIGSLLIGVETAKALALAWKKPLIAVNHMMAHVFANWIKSGDEMVPQLPAVALIVSGGHTDIMLLNSLTDWKWIGGTRDDAAGEAFDKAARAMGFPYPGGPMVAKAAGEASIGLPTEMKLPRPMIYEDNLEMSFSGLKTALVQVVEQNGERLIKEPELLNSLAREFNQAMADVLIKKTMKAVEQFKPKSVLLAGGVAANVMLREGLARAVKESGREFFLPDFKYCTDNAAMIAACALLRPDYVNPLKLRPDPGLAVS